MIAPIRARDLEALRSVAELGSQKTQSADDDMRWSFKIKSIPLLLLIKEKLGIEVLCDSD